MAKLSIFNHKLEGRLSIVIEPVYFMITTLTEFVLAGRPIKGHRAMTETPDAMQGSNRDSDSVNSRYIDAYVVI